MKLLSCYIAGFGRLQDINYVFSDHISEIFGDNGIGKTTFSVFIRAMFYGLKYSPRTKELTDRDHFRPFGGGAYGGTLTYSIDGRTHRVERTFGLKDKEDTYALYDVDTGKLISDSEDEPLGETIFGVDEESYSRSVYVPQGSVETEMTNRLNAKMGGTYGGTVSLQDDVDKYDRAVKALDEEKKKYSSTSKTNPGLLKQINEKISTCDEAVSRIPELQKAYDAKTAMLQEKKARLVQLERKKEHLSESIAELAMKEQSYGENNARIKNLEKLKATKEELASFFHGQLPSEAEMDAWDIRERQLEVNKSSRDNLRSQQPDDEEREFLNELFSGHPLTEDQLSEYQDQARKLKELRIKGEHTQISEDDRAELNELNSFFSKKDPTPEQIKQQMDNLADINAVSGQLSALEDQYHNLKQRAAEEKKHFTLGENIFGPILLVLISIVCFFGAALFFTVVSGSMTAFILGIVCVVAGIFIAVIAALSIRHRHQTGKNIQTINEEKIRASGDELEDKVKEYERLNNELNAFIDQFPNLTEKDDKQQALVEIQRKHDRWTMLKNHEEKYLSDSSMTMDQISSLQLGLYTALTPYAEVYGMNLYENADEEKLLSDLSEKLSEYKDMLKNDQDISRATAEINTETDGIRAVFKEYDMSSDNLDLNAGLKEIRQKVNKYNEADDQIVELEKEIADFGATHNIDDKSTESLESLQNRQKELDIEINQERQYIADDQKELDSRSAVLQECEEAREKRVDLASGKKRIEEHISLLEDTKKYLSQAKDEFLNAYNGPLRKHMTEYLKTIYPDADPQILSSDFELDQDLHISLTGKTGGGVTRRSEYLSRGFRDLAAFCSRIALVDVVFKGERPVIILDDPFTNFDQDKIEKAVVLLKKISEKYQVVYFTCHESREIYNKAKE